MSSRAPGLFTRIIDAIVMPRKTSSDRRRDCGVDNLIGSRFGLCSQSRARDRSVESASSILSLKIRGSNIPLYTISIIHGEEITAICSPSETRNHLACVLHRADGGRFVDQFVTVSTAAF